MKIRNNVINNRESNNNKFNKSLKRMQASKGSSSKIEKLYHINKIYLNFCLLFFILYLIHFYDGRLLAKETLQGSSQEHFSN